MIEFPSPSAIKVPVSFTEVTPLALRAFRSFSKSSMLKVLNFLVLLFILENTVKGR